MGSRGRPRGERPREVPENEPATTPGRLGAGRAARRRAAKRIRRRRRMRTTREIPLLVGIALGIALLIKTFLFQAFVIPSGSMEPTIEVDDRVVVDKLTPWFGWEPDRGDVVVFKDPGGWLAQDTGVAPGEDGPVMGPVKTALTWVGLLPQEDEDLIKRVVAIGGDTVVCCADDGRLTVNGVEVDEPYVQPGDAPSEAEFEVEVPPDRIFVLGDHRSNSADSRHHLDEEDAGTIPLDLVVGRAVVIAWPFDHWSRLGGTESFAAVPDR